MTSPRPAGFLLAAVSALLTSLAISNAAAQTLTNPDASKWSPPRPAAKHHEATKSKKSCKEFGAGFVAVAVLSLGLGIGANTAIFSLINSVMLRALPVRHPEQLVLMTDPGSGGIAIETQETGPRSILSYPEFEQFREHNTVFSGMFAAESTLSNVDLFPGRSATELPDKARAQLVSGEFFGVLGVEPFAGRVFTPEEDRAPGANPVVVISYGFWQREFGGDAGILGRTVRIGKQPFQIIGIAPARFRGILVGADPDLWAPITMQQQVLPGRDYLKPRDTLWLQVMGRLKPGVSRAKAQAGLNVVLQQMLRMWNANAASGRERLGSFDEQIVLSEGATGASTVRGQFSEPLQMLMAMVGLVLLIACANLANLMLARASARQREIGVRLALGAARGQLIRQLLTESILVAALGGIVGFVLAAWGADMLVSVVSRSVDHLELGAIHDSRVFLFTAAISILAAMLFGLAPAVRATRVDLNRSLSAARGSAGGRGQAGRVLVVAQVALSLVLVMGATLFVRSLRNLADRSLGLDRDHLLMAWVDPVGGGYKGANVQALYERLLERLRQVPGVRSVSLSNAGLFGSDYRDPVSVDVATRLKPEDSHASWTLVGPGYFTTAGIPLLRGREIDARDAERGAPVCVINQAFAQVYFPGIDPIGKHVTDEYPTTVTTFEVVGIVADAQEHSLSGPIRPRFYGNLAHPIGTVESVAFLVRAAGRPATIESSVQRAMAEVDRALPVLRIRSVSEAIDRRLITSRLMAELSASFGSVALLMAVIGLFGVMSYAMSRRTSEIGIRMALGATSQSVASMVLREALWLVGIGVAIGIPCTLACGSLIRSFLFGVTASDPTVIAFAAAVILVATLLAAYIPARRASRTDPMTALRIE